MRGLDWLLVVLAISAITAGVLVNGPVCQFISGNVEFPGPYPCVPVFPTQFVVGFAVAAEATGILVFRLFRRVRSSTN